MKKARKAFEVWALVVFAVACKSTEGVFNLLLIPAAAAHLLKMPFLADLLAAPFAGVAAYLNDAAEWALVETGVDLAPRDDELSEVSGWG